MKKKQNTLDENAMTFNTMAVLDMSPYIRCLKGEYIGYDIPVLFTGILIGRDTSVCHLIFEKTYDISRYHCRVSYNNRTGYFVITDLNSLNGVYTENGQRIASGSKLVLAPGQKFKLCEEQVIFEIVLKSSK